ncbi:hypothetical protein MGN70_011935 [Eutypa lata]|nr:hypothetical protein MGN70_011935 [Eutypa lata]
MRGILDMKHTSDSMRGTQNIVYAPMAVAELPQETVSRTIEWYESIEDQEIQKNTFIAFEYFLNTDCLSGNVSIAWPRPRGFKHLMLLVVGAPAPGSPAQLQTQRELTISAPSQILGSKARANEVTPNPAGLENYHNKRAVYGEHYDRLVALRKQYDPSNKFKGPL